MAELSGQCPICDAQVTLPMSTEVSEIVTCSDCNNSLVVSKIENVSASLEKAPEVEEDWGE